MIISCILTWYGHICICICISTWYSSTVMGSVTRNSLIFISGLCNFFSYVKIFEIFLQCANISEESSWLLISAVWKHFRLSLDNMDIVYRLFTGQTLEEESDAVPLDNLVAHLD